jgi:hypothetical protein
LLREIISFDINGVMKKSAILLVAGFTAFLLTPSAHAADWDRDHRHGGHIASANEVGNWYAGHWIYGIHGDGSGWWWVTPGGGWHLFPQAVYPYPEPPIPMPPPVIVVAPGAAPPLVVNSPYY